MTKGRSGNYPPTGLLRLGFRLPVYMYRFRLGWLFGNRFVLINHVGRKTGLPRQAVVEVVEHDKKTGGVIVVAGYGERTQWYQNLRTLPKTTIQIGSHKQQVIAEFISPEVGEEIMVRYWQRYGQLTGKLFSMLGYTWDGTEKGVRQIARDSLRFVRFIPHSTANT